MVVRYSTEHGPEPITVLFNPFIQLLIAQVLNQPQVLVKTVRPFTRHSVTFFMTIRHSCYTVRYHCIIIEFVIDRQHKNKQNNLIGY